MMTWILGKIVELLESGETNWRTEKCGRKTLNNSAKGASEIPPLYQGCSREKAIQEAIDLQEKGLVKINWLIRGSDIKSLVFHLEDRDQFYQLYRENVKPRFIPKQQRLWKYQEFLRKEMSVVQKPWIRSYYVDLLEKSEKNNGNWEPDERLKQVRQYAKCFRELDKLQKLTYAKVFASNSLEGSKNFTKEMKQYVIRQARKTNPDRTKLLDDIEVLEEIVLIRDCYQSMYIKGELLLYFVDDRGRTAAVNTKIWKYGTILEGESLLHAELEPEQPQIQKVIIFENKMNFVMAPYEEGTLYLFVGGYPGPKVCRILHKLNKISKKRQRHIDVYHSGDLDYGGIRIFQYERNQVFPDLKPLQMDADTYLQHQQYSYPIREETKRKLKKLEDGNEQIKQLLELIIQEGRGIEQESFIEVDLC